MKNITKIILSIFIIFILILMLGNAANGSISSSLNSQPDTAADGGGHVLIYTTYTSPTQDFFLPANSTGMLAFPDWHVSLYGSGNFIFNVNGVTVESGDSIDAFNFTYTFTSPAGAIVNATVTFQGVVYHYSKEQITGPVSNKQVCSVTVESTYGNSPQTLTVNAGQSGMLMYPHWIVDMQTTQNETYTIYEDGAQILSGHVDGSRTVQFNVTGNSTTVLVGLGSHVYKYDNEPIARTALNKYYAPAPPTLAYTLAQYEDGIVKAFVASFFALMIALFVARKFVLEKEKREVIRV